MNKKPLRSDDELSCCVPFSRRDFAKLVLSALGTVVAAGESAAHPAKAAPEENSLDVQEAPYESVSWTVEGLGNHRVHIAVSDKAEAVWVHIPWQRRDPTPELKGLVIVDARTGKQIQNVSHVNVKREFGDLVFQPLTAPGNYYVYYMPYTSKRMEIPGIIWTTLIEYLPPRSAADQTWLARHGLTLEHLGEEKWKALPQAKVLAIQACSDFDSFTRMEVIATGDETKQLLASHADRSYLLFPEDRYHPIRMADDLPLRWIQQGSKSELQGEACAGEFYVFQVGVYAAWRALEDLSVRYSNLEMGRGEEIEASSFRCFNLGGTDWLGRPLKKTFAVAQGKVRALWFGIEIPKEAAPGDYRGILTVQPAGSEPSQIRLSLQVKPELLNDHGDKDLWRLSRLRWLDSAIGIDDEVTAPYTPLELRGSSVHCLGREVHFAKTGLPESIRSNGREILAAPVNWVVETAAGRIPWTAGETKILKSAPGTVIRQSECGGQNLALECQAKMEFDGYINFSLRLSAKQAAEVKDIRLEIPFRKDVAAYMMGLGRKGGYRPHEWKWTWDVNRANNNVWIGDHNAGLQLELKGPEDTWGSLDLKAAGIWGNGGRGGCTVTEEDDRVVVRAYSGERRLQAGGELQFRFGLLVTPVKPLDPAHWSQRYYHILGWQGQDARPEDAVRCGATIINVHQGNKLNPYINYPFLTADKLAAYVSEAHNLGLKAKIYYTIRELSNHVAEMWALRSLGNEVFITGAGGGVSWLQEHLVTDFEPAWVTPSPNGEGELDAAIATAGLSRWHNYYLEGLAWLLRNVEIDGLYLDGIGYDREIMKRVRKVLDRNRPGSLIDFHSGNEFFNGGLTSAANTYMQHFPYINSLWFGEMYDYNESPDYWLVEISGIPFGLFGEMLQDNGNPWRGMVYGMTARYYQGADPKHIWKVWDEFGIQDAEMIGYWVPGCPVKADHDEILTTVYRKKHKALISIASWEKSP